MTCQCGSTKIFSISGKCSDLAWAQIGEVEHQGYVPDIPGVGGGDYIELDICIDCHRVQGFDASESDIIEAMEQA